MNTEPDSLTIGTFAKAAGVNVETIRFYQLKGLLPQPERPHREHPPLRAGGCGAGEVREISSAPGFQPG